MKSYNSPVISTHRLTKRYGTVSAVDCLNLQVPPHAVVGFLGPNGAGKSTTIKLLLGLVRPTSGSASIFGHDVASRGAAIRQRLGYLSQRPAFYRYMTARETLAFVARFFYTGREHIARRVDESLRLVSLKAKADRPISGFSGGELQRLGIAQAQINEPELLILDEPSSSLDPMGRAEVLAIIDRLRERSTVFYSTHILDDVERVSDHVIILNRGKLVAQGPITDILAVDSEVSYDVELNGPSSDLRIDLLTIPWVTKVDRVGQNGHTRWRIAVSSAELAERDLMRQMMSADGVQVVSFARRQRSMEDAFMQMIGETNHE